MPDISSILEAFTPGAVGIWSGVAMFGAWWLKEWRETRKLSLDDRNARREGYAKQVSLLTAENRALMADQRALREEYDLYRHACHEENNQLRQQVMALEGEVAGLLRKLAEAGIQAIRGIAMPLSPIIAEAAERSAEYYATRPAPRSPK